VVHLSWSPRAFLYRKFVTDAEAEHIKLKALSQLRKSTVVDNETGEERDSEVRTSTGTFFDKGADEVIARVEARVAQVTMLPVENQEGLQVLKYIDGQVWVCVCFGGRRCVCGCVWPRILLRACPCGAACPPSVHTTTCSTRRCTRAPPPPPGVHGAL
jgi:hypothetical protein